MREFSPDIFQRLEQASQARGLLLARAREASLSRHTIVNIPPPESRQRLSARWLPRFYAASATSIALMIAACGPTPAPLPTNPETKIPSTQGYFLPFNGPSRFTGGPHDSFRKGGIIRDGIDIAPDVSVACSPGVRKVLDEPLVVASASGTVKKVGNEKDPNDPDHSTVEIQKADGSIMGATHLDQIRVSVGDKAIGGETVIGKVSCEVPPGGKTEATHVHVFVRDKNGNQIPIEGQTFSGYTIRAAAKESDGTMTRAGGQVITAINGQRCGPDESSIKACGGKRNDLNTGAVLGAAVKAQEAPLTNPTSKLKVMPVKIENPTTGTGWKFIKVQTVLENTSERDTLNLYQWPENGEVTIPEGFTYKTSGCGYVHYGVYLPPKFRVRGDAIWDTTNTDQYSWQRRPLETCFRVPNKSFNYTLRYPNSAETNLTTDFTDPDKLRYPTDLSDSNFSEIGTNLHIPGKGTMTLANILKDDSLTSEWRKAKPNNKDIVYTLTILFTNESKGRDNSFFITLGKAGEIFGTDGFIYRSLHSDDSFRGIQGKRIGGTVEPGFTRDFKTYLILPDWFPGGKLPVGGDINQIFNFRLK